MASAATDNIRHIRDLASRIKVEQPRTLAELMSTCGVETSHFEPQPEVALVGIDEIADGYQGGSIVRSLHEAGCARLTRLDESPVYESAMGQPDGEEVGVPGNRIWGGILRDEPNPRLRPYLARGYAGYDSIYARHYRDPLVYKAVQSIREVLVSGTWEMQIPEGVPEQDRDRLREAVDWLWGKLHQVQVLGHASGWTSYIEEAAWAVLYGFSIFEVVWYLDPATGAPYPHKIAPRLASTVDRWIMSERGDTLLAVTFQTADEKATRYVLPATGPSLTDQRVLLNTIGGQANNFEGVPPTRVVDHLITYKQLLLTIAAAAAERFGSPILATRFDPALKDMAGGQDPDLTQWNAFFEDLSYMTAVETPTLQVPVGLMLEYVGAPGQMPELLAHIEYLDKQISMAWSNQATTLGQFGHGSYALASVQDDDFLRGAPYYARSITRSLNDLLRRMLKADPWGFDLDEYPTIAWRLGGAQDNTAWFSDFKTFFELAPGLPRAAQQAGLERLGLAPDTFDDGEDAPEVGGSVQDTAFTGEVNADSPPPDLPPDRSMASVPLGKSYALAEEIDPEREAQKMDRAEAELTETFEALQEEMAADWAELIRDNEGATDVVEDREAIITMYRPRYAEVIESVMLDVGKESGRDLLAKMGVEADPDLALDDALRLLAVQIADEAVNRSVGVMTEGEVARERGDTSDEIAVLTAGTLALIASKAVSSAYNAGRDQAITDSNEAEDKPTVRHAVRSAVMDPRTCEECLALDGTRYEVGTDAYYDAMPPNKCLGGARCRCVYAYEIEEE